MAMSQMRLAVEAGPSSAFMGSTAGLRASAPRPAAAPVRLQTECASSRAKKTETLDRLKKKFNPETAVFVGTVNYKGMTVSWRGAVGGSRYAGHAQRLQPGLSNLEAGGASACATSLIMAWCPSRRPPTHQVKDFETFRKKLPQGVELIVAKNTLVEKAVEGTPYAPLKAACKGTNAFLFSGEEVAGRRASRRIRRCRQPWWRRGCWRTCPALHTWLLPAARRRSPSVRVLWMPGASGCPIRAEERSSASHVSAASRPSTRWRRL